MKFKIGQLYMWRDVNSLFGKAINLYNKKNFGKEWLPTHIGIISYVDEEKGIVTIHEATNAGFVSSDYPMYWLDARIDEGKCRIGEVKEKLKNVYDNCEKYKGIRYGWLDILGIALNYLFDYRLKGYSGNNAIICSEAVSRIVYDCTTKVNFAEEYGIVYDAVSPAHIYKSQYVRIL